MTVDIKTYFESYFNAWYELFVLQTNHAGYDDLKTALFADFDDSTVPVFKLDTLRPLQLDFNIDNDIAGDLQDLTEYNAEVDRLNAELDSKRPYLLGFFERTGANSVSIFQDSVEYFIYRDTEDPMEIIVSTTNIS